MVSVPNYNFEISYPEFVGHEKKITPVSKYIKSVIKTPQKKIIKPIMMSKPIDKPTPKPIAISEPQIKINKQKKVLEKIKKQKRLVFTFIVIVASSMMAM